MPLWICDVTEKAIHETGLDGSSPTELMSGLGTFPAYLDYDATVNKFFFGLTDIRVVDYDGSNETVILDPPGGQGSISVDSTNSKLWYVNPNAREIRRADFDGGNDELVFQPTSTKPSRIFVDIAGGKVYWTKLEAGVAGLILRADLDGANEETIVTEGLETIEQLDVDLVNGKVYWSNSTTDLVKRCNLDGTNKQTIVTSAVDVWGVAVDGINGKVYYSETGPKNVKMADLDGSNQEVIWAGSTFPAYLHVSSGASSTARKTRWGPWVYLGGPGRSFGQSHHTYP